MSDNSIKTFCSLLQSYIKCEQKLDTFKMSHQQLEKAFHQLDQARRNRLDVGDLYRNFPDMKEQELFYVFKQLDLSRTGTITLQDLKAALGRNCSQIQCHVTDTVDRFKHCVKILQFNYHELQKVKHSLGVNEKSLKNIFDKISEISGENQIRTQDIIAILTGNNIDINKEIVTFISSKIMHREAMPLNQFIHFFKPFSWNQIAKNKNVQEKKETSSWKVPQKDPRQTPQRQQINKIINKYKHLDLSHARLQNQGKQYYKQDNHEPTFGLKKVSSDYDMLTLKSSMGRPFPQNQNWIQNENKNQKSQISYNVTPSWPSVQNSKISRYDKLKSEHQDITQERNTKSRLEGNLDYIEKRREQLRKGSQERKRIIQSVMKRKNNQNSYAYKCQELSKYPQRQERNLSKTGNKSMSELKKYRMARQQLHKQRNWDRQQRLTPKDYLNLDSQPPVQREQVLNARLQIPRNSNTNYYPDLTNFQNVSETSNIQFRPSSAPKNGKPGSYYQRQIGQIQNQLKLGKTEMNGFYRNKYPTNYIYDTYSKDKFSENHNGLSLDKQNILRRAQQEAARKIQQIERKARMKVMEKRSTLGIYNHWLK